MLGLLEFADILDYIYCNFIGIKKMKIEEFKNKNLIYDSYKFSQQVCRQLKKKKNNTNKFEQLSKNHKSIQVVFSGKYFASKKNDFENLHNIEILHYKQNFFQSIQKYVLQQKQSFQNQQNIRYILNSNIMHLGQFYMHQNMLQQQSTKFGFQNICSPKNSFHQISYMKLKDKNSILYGHPYHFCFFVENNIIIRNNDDQYYYYYDLKSLAQFLKLDTKIVSKFLLYCLILHTCKRKSNQDYIIFKTFEQQKCQYSDFYNKKIKQEAENVIDILLYLKTQILKKSSKFNFVLICKYFKIPYVLFNKIYRKQRMNIIYDYSKQKLLEFDFEINEFIEFQGQFFLTRAHEICYVCLLPPCFSHLLDVKKDTITFQSSQQLMTKQILYDFSEQNLKNINFLMIQKLIPILLKQIPKLIVYKQFQVIDYFRFTEKVNNVPQNIQKLIKKLHHDTQQIQNFFKSIQKNLNIFSYNKQQQLIFIQLCTNLKIFQQNFDQKNHQFTKFINFMQSKNQNLQISLMFLYCLKFNFFSVRNFLTTSNFYNVDWYKNKNKNFSKIDNKLYFEYKSELSSQDYLIALFFKNDIKLLQTDSEIQNKNIFFQKNLTSEQLKQIMKEKKYIGFLKENQNKVFFLQNILWQLEINNSFSNKFLNQENIKLIMHNIFIQTSKLLNKGDLLDWDLFSNVVINFHESINFACFLYLIISQPGNFYSCKDVVIQRQACFLNWIRNKFHSTIKVELLNSLVNNNYQNLTFDVKQLQQHIQNSQNLLDLFSKTCCPESAAIFKELLVTQAIRQQIIVQFPNLELFFSKKVKQLKQKLLRKNLSLEQFIEFLKILKHCFKKSKINHLYQAIYKKIKVSQNLLQTF